MMDKQNQHKQTDDKQRNAGHGGDLRDRAIIGLPAHQDQACNQKQDRADETAQRILGFGVPHEVANGARPQRTGRKGKHHHRDRQRKGGHRHKRRQQRRCQILDRFNRFKARPEIGQAGNDIFARQPDGQQRKYRTANRIKQRSEPQAVADKFPYSDKAVKHVP